jgi:hypothetical protein
MSQVEVESHGCLDLGLDTWDLGLSNTTDKSSGYITSEIEPSFQKKFLVGAKL